MNREFIATVAWVGALSFGIVAFNFDAVRLETVVPAIAFAVVTGLICAVGTSRDV